MDGGQDGLRGGEPILDRHAAEDQSFADQRELVKHVGVDETLAQNPAAGDLLARAWRIGI
jgi:hypothetical protein